MPNDDLLESSALAASALSAADQALGLLNRLRAVAYRCGADSTRSMEFISEGCLAITGYRPSVLVSDGGPSWNDLIVPEDRTMVWEAVQEAVRQRLPFEIDYRITTAQGDEKWLRDRGAGVFADGALVALEGIATDTSLSHAAEAAVLHANAALELRVSNRTHDLEASNERLRFANDRLLAAVDELEQVNSRLDKATRAKSEFLANMSHELRTPLNSILGFSGLILEGIAGPVDPEQFKQIGMINASGRHLLALINDVLDLSKIEADQLSIEVGDIDATEVVSAAVSKVRPMADAKSLALTEHFGAGIGPMRSDPRRLEQILLNLLSNAVKFTKQGAVSVDVARADGHCLFSVSDTGRGVDPADLDHIFEAFYQCRQFGEVKPEGTGLGLSLSRKMARMLGGELLVSSQVGRGSTFTLRVPTSSEAARQLSEALEDR